MAAQVLRPVRSTTTATLFMRTDHLPPLTQDMSRPASVSPASLPTSPRARPTDDDIEAVIQLATSARPSADGRTVPLRDTRTQLFVGNLPYRVRWQDLKDLFRKAGTVLRADVSLGPDNRSRGYGTVLLATAEDAGRAIDMFNGYNWQTRVLEVRPDRLPPDLEGQSAPAAAQGVPLLSPMGVQSAYPPALASPLGQTFFHSDELLSRPASSAPGARTLFVGNLPFHCQWQDLKDLFRQAGTILRADVALGQDGRSRGFGMVSFASELDADRAVKMFNGYEYNGRPLKVHHDKFAGSTQPLTAPTSPLPTGGFAHSQSGNSLGGIGSPGMHIPLPQHTGYPFEMFLASGPSTPYSMYPAHVHSYQVQNAVLQRMPSDQPYDGSPTHGTPPHPNDSPSHTTSASGPGSNRPSPHGHHPGPIALPPPPPPGTILMPGTHALSPYAHPLGTPLGHLMHVHPHGHHPHVLMTPHGLPPITPSMPSFTFVAQPSPAGAAPPGGALHGLGLGPSITGGGRMPAVAEDGSPGPGGSPAHDGGVNGVEGGAPPHPQGLTSPGGPSFGAYGHPMGPMAGYAASIGLLSPGVPFSPGVALTPGSFWGPPGRAYMNPAVGAPVHLPQQQQQQQQQQGEPASYFPSVDAGYFPPVGGALERALSNGSGSGSSLGAGSPATGETNRTGDTSLDGAAGMDGLLGRLGKLGLAPTAPPPPHVDAGAHARKDSRTFSLSARPRPTGLSAGAALEAPAPPAMHRGDSDPPPAAHQPPFVASAFGGAGRVAAPRHLSADALGGGAGKRAVLPPSALSLAGLGLGIEGKRSF